MTDQDFRALNAELGFPPEAADRLLHDRRADERRDRTVMERSAARLRPMAKSKEEAEVQGDYLWESALTVLEIGTPTSQVTASWALPWEKRI